MAAKRAASNTAAMAALITLGIQTTRQTVCQWQARLAANIRTQTKAWHTAHESYARYCYLVLSENAGRVRRDYGRVWS